MSFLVSILTSQEGRKRLVQGVSALTQHSRAQHLLTQLHHPFFLPFLSLVTDLHLIHVVDLLFQQEKKNKKIDHGTFGRL